MDLTIPPAASLESECRSHICSNLGLTAEFNHAIRRYAEEIRRRKRIAVHELEDGATKAPKSRLLRRHDLHPPDEKRRLHHIEMEALGGATMHDARHVRVLHEAILGDDRVEVTAQIRELEPPLRRYPRNVRRDDMQKHDPLVQHFVVL